MGGPINQYEILDDQGHETGQILDREIVHAQQLWHEVVNIWIMNSRGEVLLQLRAPGVELSPNVWDVAVGSHVRPGEDPLAAAQRCLQHELGLTIAPDNLKHLFNIQAGNPMADGRKHKVLGHVFLVRRDINLVDITLNKEKITQLAWKPLVEIMGDIGNPEAAKHYFPRDGSYYPRLFDALQSQINL
ncbi:MAG TPA: NUDIX domain-containing protein [Candidatus Saccharimonadales bacterium]|nr:NUDIX domain-containing protein [Candidatus Saccharimonadales bacterium]